MRSAAFARPELRFALWRETCSSPAVHIDAFHHSTPGPRALRTVLFSLSRCSDAAGADVRCRRVVLLRDHGMHAEFMDQAVRRREPY